MNKLFLSIIISAGILSAALIYNTTDSKNKYQEKFDGISKATKPNKRSMVS